jgi:hypothetical protein
MSFVGCYIHARHNLSVPDLNTLFSTSIQLGLYFEGSARFTITRAVLQDCRRTGTSLGTYGAEKGKQPHT